MEIKESVIGCGMEKRIKESVISCLEWIETQMLSFNRGSWGVYERIRTDINERVCLSRPDVASEYLRTLYLYRLNYKDYRYDDAYENVLNWLLYSQNSMEVEKNSGFPFSLVDGNKRYPSERVLYQNDNGKILINLLYLYEKTQDVRLKIAANRLADFWLDIQTSEGFFHDADIKELQPFPSSPCFVLWLMAGLYYSYNIFGDKKYLKGGQKAFEYILSIIEEGRLKTSYELTGTEYWRPPSSENYIALYCLKLASRFDADIRLANTIDSLYPYCESLIDKKTGAIRNCTSDTALAAKECSSSIVDLVYTQGYALNALIEIGKYEEAERLAGFLMDIQIKNENILVNGAWRGSYSLDLSRYAGRCNNGMEEGGEFSVYTGWCALPNLIGLLSLSRAF